METGFLIAVIFIGFFCFYQLGAMSGRGRDDGKKLPKADMMKPLQDTRARREAQREKEYLDALLRNIDNYDGTGCGQEDLPGR